MTKTTFKVARAVCIITAIPIVLILCFAVFMLWGFHNNMEFTKTVPSTSIMLIEILLITIYGISAVIWERSIFSLTKRTMVFKGEWNLLIDLSDSESPKMARVGPGRYELELIPDPQNQPSGGWWLVLKGTKIGHLESFLQTSARNYPDILEIIEEKP